MINILGININTKKKTEILKEIQSFLLSGKQKYIITPNPEIVLLAQTDEEYFYILNHAALSLADGVGLKFTSWLLGKRMPRITGSDLSSDLLLLAEKNNYPVLVVNWSKGLSSKEEIIYAVKNNYPEIKIEVWDLDREEGLNHDWSPPKTEAKIMFVTLGAPFQEKFIFHQLKKINSVNLAIGVGGSFDFITKKAIRAPKVFRLLGLEWLYRLMRQPKKRIGRIYRATLLFVWKIIIWRFILPFRYRSNVACFLYKIIDNQPYILLLERSDGLNHWQMPQGGTDGLGFKKAGIKELSEEINNKNFKVKAVFGYLYKYLNQGKRHTGYKGQKQGLIIAEFLGRDEEIKLNFWEHRDYKWVKVDKLLKECHSLRREGYQIYLKKFYELI